MDLVVADDRTVPYIYLLNIIVAEEDLKLIIVFSQRYEILRIKPEGSQKERGGGGRAGEERKDGSQTVPLDSAT